MDAHSVRRQFIERAIEHRFGLLLVFRGIDSNYSYPNANSDSPIQ